MQKYFIFILINFCATHTIAQNTETPTPPQQSQNTLKLLPVLWQQTSAEYRALCYQAFNIAETRLNQLPKKKFRKEKLAIITDLDETILDNSYSEAQLIKEGKEHNKVTWKEWTQKSEATAVPGSVEFLQAASKRGVTIFYISNRGTSDLESTLINLKKLNLPNADLSHMLFLTNSSSKEVRRNIVAEKYNIVMLLGDNLNDFMNVFEIKPIEERFAETDKVKAEWGNKFIVLPNSTYGEWENALYNYQYNLTPAQKQELLQNTLKGY